MTHKKQNKPDPAPGPDLTDEQLIRRCLDGQPEAYRVLVERYWSMVYSIARRIANSHDDAVDVTQEAFVRAYEHLSGFARDAKFSTWLLRVATNYALDQKRRRTARVRLQQFVPLTGYAPPADLPAIMKESESQLAEMLRTLSHHQRLCLVLKVVHDMSTAEVAEILGCSEGTVRVHLHQARKLLRDRWDGWRP
jgi:RNA polymerase sigma-70 factor (ECF subfamily)